MNSQVVTVTAQTTDTIVLPPNSQRRCLTVYNLGGNNVYLAFGAAAVLTQGELVLPSQLPLKLTWYSHGQRLCESLHAIANVGPVVITVVEAFD